VVACVVSAQKPSRSMCLSTRYDMDMETFKDIPVLSFEDVAQWETWLADHYDLQSGIWLKIAKKKSGVTSVSYSEALDIALCYGWIDGQGRSYDDLYYLQKFTPRRPKSLWSKINIGKVEALIAAGKMKAPGLAAIAAAKEDGRWDAAYDSQKNASVPPDLAAALENNTPAKNFFQSLNKANQYAFIWRLMTAKTAEKRAERLQKFVAMLEEGKALH
jgi:uncharacterized protein YdeI (YjbR/CyaY-like superfamily)